MGKRKGTRVHADATKESGALRWSACGFAFAGPSFTTDDITAVTCKACLRVLSGRAPKPRGEKHLDQSTLLRDLHAELGLRPELTPSAGPVPRLTPQLWARCVRGGGRCHADDCDLCAWEQRAERFAFAAPWNRQHVQRRDDRPTPFTSMAAALRALVEHEQTGRDLSSPLAAMLSRLERMDGGGRPDARRTSAQVRSADYVLDVRRAIERAVAGQHVLTADERIRLLLERTPGVLERVTPYEELAARLGLSIGELQSVVRRTRHVLDDELASRGLIPASAMKPRVHERADSWTYHAPDADQISHLGE